MVQKIALKTYVIRICFTLFWVFIIGIFLTSPRFISLKRCSRSLNVLAMPNSINADMFTMFEQEHSIKINLTYAESADEMYMKLCTTGACGYDLVMIADYQLSLLRQKNLLQKIDTTKLTFFNDFYPALLNHSFDPENNYSIPYYWGVYGFAVDSTYFGAVEDMGWDAIFDEKKINYCIGMREDSREIILMAALYLFGRIHDLGPTEYDAIKKLLIRQKQWVTMYADERIGALLISHYCPLVVTLTGDIMRTITSYPHIQFYVPREGGFVDIDSFVIPTGTSKIAEIYAFLNYIYTPEILQYYIDLFQFASPLKTVLSKTSLPAIFVPTEALFKRLYFFDGNIPYEIVSSIIIALKTA